MREARARMTSRRSRAAVALSALAGVAACGSGGNPAPAGGSCGGFVMPNPAGAGLPNPASYTVDADGTVTDDVTRLVWERGVDDASFMQDAAGAHCAAKGAAWRLPTRLELLSLVDFTIAAPGPTIAAAFGDTPATTFWTSSPYYGDVGDAWYVGFDAGYSDYGIVNQSSRVRCVRPAVVPDCRPTRFSNTDDGLVLDRASGLTWQRTLDPGSYTWDGALALCAGLGAGWRVPSLTEAQTIIDDSKEFPAVDASAFPDTPSVDFWTSTPRAGDPGAAWYVDFFYGASDSDVAARLFRVRCVR